MTMVKSSCIKTLGLGQVRFSISESIDTGNHVITLVTLPNGKFKTGDIVLTNTLEHLLAVNNNNMVIEVVKSDDGPKGIQTMMTNVCTLIKIMKKEGFKGRETCKCR